MSFAEIVLRLGVTFVSWLLVYLHLLALWIVTLSQCPGGDTAPWKMSFLTGLLAVGAAIAAPYGHRTPGMERTFRFFALPLLALIPWAAVVAWPYLNGVTFAELQLCTVKTGDAIDAPATGWQRAWAPLQFVALAAFVITGWRVWQIARTA